MAVPDVIRECMMVTMSFLSNRKPQHVIWKTRFIGRSLQLYSIEDQQFIQVCKSVNQALCLAGAGAWRVLVDRPLLDSICSNDPWALSQRLPRHGLCFWQHEDRGWVFCTSTQRSRQRSFLRRFRRQPRHRRRRPPRKCWQICVTWATNIYGHKYIGASATCVRL